MAHDYKVGDRVEAQRSEDTTNGWHPAEVVGFSEANDWVFVKYLSGGDMDVWRVEGPNIRPLPAPAATFKVGDEVEVRHRGRDHAWVRATVTSVVKREQAAHDWRIFYRLKDDHVEGTEPSILAPDPDYIRPYTPPQTRRVPLGAGDFPPGTVVRDADWGGDSWAFVTGVSPSGIEANEAHNGVTEKPGAFFLVRHFSFRELLERDFTYATPTDRNPNGSILWKPCRKEEVVANG